jgi:hypothetical protein
VKDDDEAVECEEAKMDCSVIPNAAETMKTKSTQK